MKKIISKSLEDTQKIADDFARDLKEGMNIALVGDLGSGKTTFVSCLADSLGGAPDDHPVHSPTFSLLHEYVTPTFTLYHFDLYRLDTYAQWEVLDFEDYLHGPGICLVEWGDKFNEILPYFDWKLEFKSMGENQRQITIQKLK